MSWWVITHIIEVLDALQFSSIGHSDRAAISASPKTISAIEQQATQARESASLAQQREQQLQQMFASIRVEISSFKQKNRSHQQRHAENFNGNHDAWPHWSLIMAWESVDVERVDVYMDSDSAKGPQKENRRGEV